jgi:hypothetical protein
MHRFLLNRELKISLVFGACAIALLLILFFLVEMRESLVELDSTESEERTFLVDTASQEYFKTDPTFPELSDYLGVLADEKGAIYALNTLIYGDLPANIDSHLMGHFVARKLYKEQGIEGLQYCTDDLGYACAHAIVIEALFERGMEVFDEVNDICARVEGPGAYFMCFHGFGHGVLAFADYELPKALELCEKVGTEAYGDYESVECAGGAIMEMRGGIHDPELWEKNGKKYLNEKKPIDMCLADFMAEKYRYICFVYLTPFIFDSLGAADLPSFEEYGPAIRSCDVLLDPKYREACFGGFAKEFVGFLFGRDIRKIEGITNEQLGEVLAACSLAEVEDGIAGCIKHAIIDLLGGGQHGFEIAGRLCELVDTQHKEYCVSSYITTVHDQHALDEKQYGEFCGYIEETFGRSCSV